MEVLRRMVQELDASVTVAVSLGQKYRHQLLHDAAGLDVPKHAASTQLHDFVFKRLERLTMSFLRVF